MRNIIFCLFMMSIILVSCHSKNEPLAELYDLVSQLIKDTSDYTEEDWEAVTAKLEKIEDKIQENSDQYTDEEMREIGRLKGKCVGLIVKKAMNSTSKQLKDASRQTEGLLEGLFEGLDEDEKK